MTDKLADLLREFRFWRSSVPTGLVLGALVVLGAVHRWPVLAEPGHGLSAPYVPLVAFVGKPGWLLIGLLATALLGSWWSSLWSAILIFGVRELIAGAPLDVAPEAWSRGQRWALMPALSLSCVRSLRRSMLSVSDYGDLLPADRPAAFSRCVREAIELRPPVESDAGSSVSLIRDWVDLRLSAGLLFAFPVALVLAPNLLQTPLPDASTFCRIAAAVSFAVLAAQSVTRARRIAESLLTLRATADFLGDCARAAVDSGRSAAAREDADDRRL